MKGLFLISIVTFWGVIAILTLAYPENVFAFKPVGPTEAIPTQPLEQLETTQESESPISMSASPFLNYENSTFGMRILYPYNWTKYESHDGSSPLIVQFTDKPVASGFGEITSLGLLNITGRPVTLNASTSDLSLYLQEQLNDSVTTLPSFNLIETRNTTINAHQQNIPATMTLYSYQDLMHNEVYVLTVDILKDGRHYSLEYSAEPDRYFKNSQILMDMVDSFEITQAPNTTMVVSPSTNLKSYENTTMGISIEYPDNWNYEEEGDHVTFHFPMGLLLVGAGNTDFSSSQQALINFTSYGLKNISGFDLIQFEPVDLRGVSTSSDLRVFTQNSGLGSIYKTTQIVTVFGGKIYLIDILADPAVYPIFEPTFLRMIDSFQIKDRPDDTAAGSTTPMQIPLTYENSVYGVKVDYPSNWSATPKANASGVTLYSPENVDYVTLELVIEDLSEYGGQNLVQYLDSSISLYNNTPEDYPGFILNSSEIAGSLAGSPAYSLEGSYNDPKLGIQNLMDTGTIRGNVAYYVRYIGSPSKYVEYLPTVKAMIDSIEITKSTPTPTSAPAPTPAPTTLSSKFGLDKSQDVNLENGTSYPMRYKITGGQVNSIDLGRTIAGKPSLIISIMPEQDPEDFSQGVLVVEIPRSVLDSKDSGTNQDRNFMVYADEWKELARDLKAAVIEAKFNEYTDIISIDGTG